MLKQYVKFPQGVICFESLMEEGCIQGIVTDNKPVICKPNKLVSTLLDTVSTDYLLGI